jgi:DNA anti-recombination protein RmuC
MNPASPDNRELPASVRQQLVLAQVRLLELTDAREALATQVTLLERTLAEAQALANAGTAGQAHLAAVNTRLEAHAGQLQVQLDHLQAERKKGAEQLAALTDALARTEQVAADRLRRSTELQDKLRTMQATRSWRWTAPFRALGGNPPGHK